MAWRLRPLALAALDFLAGVVAARSSSLGGLDALTINHRRRGAGLSPGPFAVHHDQVVVDGLKQTLAAKAQEPAVDCRTGRGILGRQAPGATRSQHLEDRVHDLAHRPAPRPTRHGRLRHERGHNLPLLLGRVASITLVIAAMLPPVDRRPLDRLQTGFDNRLESHLDSAVHPQPEFQNDL